MSSKAGECWGGIVGYLFGHNMRPRYDTAREAPEWFTEFIKRAGGKVEADYPQQDERISYICDVCVRCGFMTRPGMDLPYE